MNTDPKDSIAAGLKKPGVIWDRPRVVFVRDYVRWRCGHVEYVRANVRSLPNR